MRKALLCSLTAAFVALTGTAARADHVPTTVGATPAVRTDSPQVTHGEARLATNLSTVARGIAGPLGDGGAFRRGGRTYMLATDMFFGLHVVDVTDPLAPTVVSRYSSSFGCPTANAEFAAARENIRTGLPFSLFTLLFEGALGTIQYENDLAFTPDGRFAVIGMDAPDRCHDPAAGGLELVDLTDLTNPRTVHPTRNRGQAHSVTIDPSNPGLALLSSSDGNDFIEIVDFRSCYEAGASDLDACRPVVARAVFAAKHMPGIEPGAEDPAADRVTQGCHDIRFEGALLYCAAINNTLVLDASEMLDDGRLTGTHLTAGDHACPIVDAVRSPGVTVTDCWSWTEAAFEERSATSVRMTALSVIPHDGARPPTEDVEIAHQAEPIENGDVMIVTDERGGGLGFGPPGRLCDPTGARCLNNRHGGQCPGGGMWFYDVRDPSRARLMQLPNGDPASFFTEHTPDSQASCTVHYGQQVPGENLLVFAWYTGGTHVIRYEIDDSKSPPVISFEEVAAYVPAAAWTIQAKPMGRNPANPDELIVYAADASRGLDVLVFDVPAEAAGTAGGGGGAGGGAEVLGKSHARDLPATGADDPMTLALALVAVATALARRLRTAR